MQVMNNSTSPQVKHILPHAAIAGTAALPMSNVAEARLHRDALAQLRAPMRCPLAFTQLRQQGFIGMNADAPPAGLVVQRSRNAQPAQVDAGNSTVPPGSKGMTTPPGHCSSRRSQSKWKALLGKYGP